MSFFEHLPTAISDKFGSLLAAFIVSIATIVLLALFRYCRRHIQQFLYFVRSRRRALNAVGRQPTSSGLREGKGVWLTEPIDQPEDYERRVTASRVLAVANLKGGVGKTTLTANIGAVLAKEYGLRVLLIDLDFQGSLSSMAFPQGGWLPLDGQDSLASQLISNDIRPQLVPSVAKPVPLGSGFVGPGSLCIIPCFYDLAQADNRLMVEWLLTCQPKWSRSPNLALLEMLGLRKFKLQDVRYTLAEILQADVVQKAFDIVIIDCPPRLTTSAIQAFCASSHLLVPTIFDRTSAEAVLSFHQQIETLKNGKICPALKYVGVVGTKWRPNEVNPPRWKTEVEELLCDTDLRVLSSDMFFRHAAAFVKYADDGIAYLVSSEIQANAETILPMKKLAGYIVERMGIPSRRPSMLVAAE